MHRRTTLSRPAMGAETNPGSNSEGSDSSVDSHSGPTRTQAEVGAVWSWSPAMRL